MRVLWGAALGACGLMVLFAIVIGLGETLDPTATETEVTQQKPFTDFIGREYRVISAVSAIAWNDFPNKDRILSVALTPPPGTRNRFVSWVRPLKLGQIVRPISAWRRASAIGAVSWSYNVSVPGAELSEDLRITVNTTSDGTLNPTIYELIR